MKIKFPCFLIILFSLFTACSSSKDFIGSGSLSVGSLLNDSLLTKLRPGNNLDLLSKKLGENSTVNEMFSYKEKFLMELIEWMHVPYQYGGKTKRGVDCTGFTQAVFRKSLGVRVSRSAFSQYQEGISIDNVDELKFGDLVFFNTNQKTNPGHAGIYVGRGNYKNGVANFVHASSSRGVMISKLKNSYWKTRYVGARRIEEASKKLN